MLFSNFLDNVPKFSEFVDSLSIGRCYYNMYHQLKSLAGDNFATFGQSKCMTQAKHHNQNRTRWKGHQSDMPNRLPHQNITRQHQRTLTPHSTIAVFLFFIVLLSHDQMTTVNGAHSRDSLNSIYQNNNSVNSITITDLIASATIDTNVVKQIDDEMPIIDIENFSNVTNDVELGKFLSESEYSSGRKLKRQSIYQNEFAVYIPNGVAVADKVAAKHGFTNTGQVSSVLIEFLSCGHLNRKHGLRPSCLN